MMDGIVVLFVKAGIESKGFWESDEFSRDHRSIEEFKRKNSIEKNVIKHFKEIIDEFF